MSFNQSRSDKSDAYPQYRKSGRSTSFQQRGSSTIHSKPGGAGGSAPSPSITSNRSFKKSNNVQGGQSRAGVATVNTTDSGNSSTPRGVQNGARVQQPSPGVVDAPSTVAKPTDSPATQRSIPAVPKVPASQSASLSSDTTAPTTPSKAGDQPKTFPFQFGSISPGFMNKMQIPARTSSAPPNLDEQKRDQARLDSLRPVPPLPTPSAPKPQFQRKDGGAADQPNTGEGHALPKARRDMQPSPTPVPPTNQTQKPSVLPMTGITMPMPFQQSQVSVPFGGPNQQIQSQGMAASSLHLPMAMPMPLPMGSTSQVQQQIFVSGLHPHPLQPQVVHQGQSLGYATQIGSQLPPQSNLGINIATPQYPQQPGGNFAGHRKSVVRIIDPNTNKEVRFEKRLEGYSDTGSTTSRSYPNLAQTQPLPSYAQSHQISYYHNSYNTNSPYFASPGSLPLPGGLIAPNLQTQRYNFPVSQGAQDVAFMNPSALGSISVNKIGSPIHGMSDPMNLDSARDSHNVISSASPASVHVTVRPPTGSVGEKVTDSVTNSLLTVEKGESHKSSRSSREVDPSNTQRDSELSSEKSLRISKPPSQNLVIPVAAKHSGVAAATISIDGKVSSLEPSVAASPSDESELIVTGNEGTTRENISRSDSVDNHETKLDKKGPILPEPQSTSTLDLPPRDTGRLETLDVKAAATPQVIGDCAESVRESLSSVNAMTPNTSESRASNLAGSTPASEISCATAISISDPSVQTKQELSLPNEQLKLKSPRTEEQGENRLSEVPIKHLESSEVLSAQTSLKSLEFAGQIEPEPVLKSTTVSNEVPSLEAVKKGLDEPVTCRAEVDSISENLDEFTSTALETTGVRSSISGRTSALDASSRRRDDIMCSGEATLTEYSRSDQPSSPTYPADGKHEQEVVEAVDSGEISLSQPASKDKCLLEINRPKSAINRGKKKLKEILLKADAAGTTSDLYNAYKRPEGKNGTLMSPDDTESTEGSSANLDLKQVCDDALKEKVATSEKDAQGKAEPDDWEDAADLSTPKLETSYHGKHVNGVVLDDKDGNGNMTKKYSKDFLLKFAEVFTDLPQGFENTPDIEALISANASISHLDRDSYPSPGRIDRQPSGGPRLDRRGTGLVDDDRWSKVPSPSVRDPRLDLAYGANAGLRTGQGANYGVLRNPRAQTPVHFAGGILSGPMQAVGSQGGMQRNGPDAERWQRAANVQKGLIPSPQTPMQTMHKADKKYEVGKVADEEQAKQRQLKAILNKLTPQNFEKLFEQVKAVNIDNATTLTGVISQIFDKALMEPTFCEMYANFCYHLAGELPDFSEDNEKITFKRLLLNKCQEEFERGEREQEEANKVDEEGEIKQSDEEREEKRIKARRRMLGNIRLIGELYKKRMLTERIMHECIKKLLGQYQNPDEEDVEALCKLMSTIGEMIDHPKAKEHMDAYFDMMAKLSNNMKLSSRVRFMLKDSIDLRRNKWQQRRKVEGPKKIEEVHRDAAQERQAQTSRLSRGPGMNPSARRGAPVEFGPRGGSNVLSSPHVQSGGFRGFPSQVRGYGSQDVRMEDRPSYEARTLSVPLPQRPIGDDSITLGPQGGLARGMSIRGPQAMTGSSLADISPISGDSRRMAPGLNGYSSTSERATYNSSNVIPRYAPDRFAGPAALDQSTAQDRSISRDLRNSDRSFDKSLPTSPTIRGQGSTLRPNVPEENVMSEDCLRDMSMAAIKEFYSARDEKEVALCIKDLNSPSFHPSMISLWVSDSFERKDIERDLLAELLVNLLKSGDVALSQAQLIKGFESVFTTLEDAVNDAPKAPEFMGRILARVILENVVQLGEIGRLIYEGGEEPGRLVQFGLAADVLGNILEVIRSVGGERVLNEICKSSNLRLETFRPPEPIKSIILEEFISSQRFGTHL